VSGSASEPAYSLGTAASPQLRWARRRGEIELALELRERVFCDEQGVPVSEERDALDDRASHMIAVDPEGAVVGTLRLLVSGRLARIGRIAVRADWRRRGIASAMLDAALQAALERGCGEARLAAQVQAVGLYQRSGFRAVSDPFHEAGIAHVWMRRGLA
jgi:predicted GNAT family N-acyltransferase